MAQSKAQTQKNATEKECVLFHVLCFVHNHPKKSPPWAHIFRAQLMFALGIDPIGALLTEIRRGEVRKVNQKTQIRLYLR